MLEPAIEAVRGLIERGGWVIWPLGALSVIALTLIFERCWFFIRLNNPWRLARFRRVGQCLRQGRDDRVDALIGSDGSPYGELVRHMSDEGSGEAAVTEAIERQRPRLERFMPTLGTIITAAPMLGILGTVTGIISAFQVLSDQAVTDPSEVGAGIAEALVTTVAGLIVALVVLFPYNAFRAQIERSMGRMETLVAAARARNGGADRGTNQSAQQTQRRTEQVGA